jgi:hypothetical protein
MVTAEEDALQGDAQGGALGPSTELPLQVTAKDGFLLEANSPYSSRRFGELLGDLRGCASWPIRRAAQVCDLACRGQGQRI